MKHKVFIGFDSREKIASDVCEKSLKQNSKKKIHIKLLDQKKLRSKKLYYRKFDPLSSTEFTFTRFLIPYLSKYKGWSLFCDCDFLFLEDVSNLFKDLDEKKAIYCVQHDYAPKEKHKMNGQKQTLYPRKNWSSFIIFNCAHPSNKKLTIDLVNSESGSFLHQFKWLDDNEIGSLDERWNWLEGWSSSSNNLTPFAIHFTRGGPWFDEWQDVDYAIDWLSARDIYLQNKFSNF